MSSLFGDENGRPAEPRKGQTGNFLDLADDEERESEPFVLSEAPPTSPAEIARSSGLAFSAGIAFFGSVVFMLVIGWFADLLLGSSPWGLVGGIVLGSAIGFVQFFRTTSQIFKK